MKMKDVGKNERKIVLISNSLFGLTSNSFVLPLFLSLFLLSFYFFELNMS